MSETSQKTIILTQKDIARKLERIAYEIYEENYEEKELYLIGIKRRGSALARKIKSILERISDLELKLLTVNLNKANPVEEDIELNKEIKKMDGKVAIVIDDVANTGRTLCYAIKPMLEHLPKKIQVAVLVDRQHKLFPICADYVGITLSTTLQEHITFEMEGKKQSVFLE